MADFFAIAPVLAFAAFAVGSVLAIRSMLKELADKFRQIALEPALRADPHHRLPRRELHRKSAASEVVALPRRTAALRPKLRAPLPVAA